MAIESNICGVRLTVSRDRNGADFEYVTQITNRCRVVIMITNIKEVVAKAKADGATIVNNAKITGISFFPAAEGKNVDYWANLTISEIIPGMIAEGEGDNKVFKKGNTTVVTVPMGSVITCFFDALMAVESREARKLGAYKAIIVADAKKEALSDKNAPYISRLHELLTYTAVSVIARDVKKGKVKSLFSINAKEVDCVRDSVWHDIYGLANLDADEIADALAFCKASNQQNAAANATNKQDALAALMEAYKQNSANSAVEAALA